MCRNALDFIGRFEFRSNRSEIVGCFWLKNLMIIFVSEDDEIGPLSSAYAK